MKSAGFPVHLLPDVCAAGTIAGVLNRDYYGIPAGAKVGLALGDLQCSVLASTDIDSHAGTAVMLVAHHDSTVLWYATRFYMGQHMLRSLRMANLCAKFYREIGWLVLVITELKTALYMSRNVYDSTFES